MQYPHRADVYSRELRKDDYGSTEEIFRVKQRNYKCWVQPNRSREEEVDHRNTARDYMTLYGKNIGLQISDKLEIKSEPYMNTEFEIVGIMQLGGLKNVVECDLERIHE